jgi:hypothetical protein
MIRVGLGRAAYLALLVVSLPIAAQERLRLDVGTNTSALYVKECGACHFAYQPGWLPERSWQRIMGNLKQHFGEDVDLKVREREALTAYLRAGAAEHAANQRSRSIIRSIAPGDTPTSVTQVLYVGGIHGGFLDPKFKGKPEVKTLSNCAACHPRADGGNFYHVRYVVSDESFRTDELDRDSSAPLPGFFRSRK